MSQSLANVLVHLVFSTKNRRRWIKDELRPQLHSYLTVTLSSQGSESLAINSVSDHIHILFRLSRSTSLSTIVKELKTGSSRWMKQKGTFNFYWQAGYAAFSVSCSQVGSVRRYIAERAKHHRRLTFQEEFRRFMGKHQLDYDEKYVWD